MEHKLSKEVIAAQMEVMNHSVAPWQTQVLFSIFNIGIFELLEKKPASSENMAKSLGVPLEPLIRLADCGVILGFLVKKKGLYYNGSVPRQTLVKGKPGYMGNWLALAARWYHSFGKLTEAICSNTSTEDVNFTNDSDYQYLFIKGMADYANYRGKDILNYLDLSRSERILDVGCGPAAYSVIFCRKYPDLSCVCLDLPHAVSIAEKYVADNKMENRISFISGDYKNIDFSGTGFNSAFDVAFLSHVLHQENRVNCIKLLKKAYTALKPGGIIVIQAMFPDHKGFGSSFTALHDLLAFLVFSHGKNHTLSDTDAWLKAAGFTDIRHCKMSLLNINSLMIGVKK